MVNPAGGHDALRFHYFQLNAVGQFAMYIMEAGGIPYVRETKMSDNWGEWKAKTPFGQMPVLEIPGAGKIAQSMAIVEYLASIAGLIPKDPYTNARVQMLYAQYRDMRTALGKAKYSGTSSMGADGFTPDMPAQEKAFGALEKETLPRMLKHAEALIPDSGPYFLGQAASLADIAIFAMCRICMEADMGGLVDMVPKMKRVHDAALKMGTLEKFLKKDKGPIYYKMGKFP